MAYTDIYNPNYPVQDSSGKWEYRLGQCTWYIESQNVLENTTTLMFKVDVGISVPEEELRKNGSTRVQLELDGKVVKDFYFATPGSSEYYSYTVKHNGYGQRVIEIAVVYYNYGGLPSSEATMDYKYYVPTIRQMAHVLSAPAAFNDEENPVISYRCYRNTAAAVITTNTNTEELDIIVSHPIASATEQVSYTFELTEEERDELRLRCKIANSMKLYIGVYSSVGESTLYSYKETIFSVINADPTATGTVKDINPVTLALTGDENTLIRYASTAAVTAQYTAYKQATLAGFWIEHNSNIFPETSHVFEKVEGNIFAFHATDSRGNTGESFIQTPMIEYLKLTCNLDTTEKPDTDGVMNLKCSGNFYNDTFGYTSAATANTLKIQYRYKLHGFNTTYNEWADMPFTINDDNTYEAAIVLDGFEYRNTYVFQCRAIDILSDVLSIEYVSKSLPVFHWGEDDFVFEVPVTFNAPTIGIEHPTPPPDYTYGGTMDGDLDITGNLRLKGDGNYGNSIYFGDKEYASIQELTDDTLTITASTIKLNGTVKLNDQTFESGEWYPTLDVARAESYISNYGWYQRIGNVVTAGFFVKADCSTGYHTSLVGLNGLPFTPVETGSGGGMCSGALISGGFNFQCWAVGTNGKITPRVQACNNTTALPLSTSASGLFYPQGGGEITLSGTITFMVE